MPPDQQNQQAQLTVYKKINLEIKILFVFSPEFLATYGDIQQLINDNTNFCQITEGILNHNIPQYNINIINSACFLCDGLQGGKLCLNLQEINIILQWYINGGLPLIHRLQELVHAHFVVFNTAMVSGCIGMSANTTFTGAKNVAIALCRGMDLKNLKTSKKAPLLLAHELGHALGAYHPVLAHQKLKRSFLPYCGHHVIDSAALSLKDARNGTIMSYCLKPTWYFSNPNLFRYHYPDQNIPCGQKGVAEVYKIITKNLPLLASPI